MAPLSDEYNIPGGYQLDALLHGWALQRAWHRARLDLIAHVLPPSRDALVLDAAAGSGIVSYRFGQMNIVSTDLRVSACQAVRSHSPSARTVAAELCALPFRSARFSQVYFLEAIEHLTADQGLRALGELRRVARAGARCLITTPNYRSHWLLLEHLVDTLGVTLPMADVQHQSKYDRDALARAAESTGWRVATLGSFNFLAPFLGMVSSRAGAWAIALETSYLRRGGALLYAVCERMGQDEA